jgi:flavin reductase (DIM6/NTAB) family NADH-FMN oxidoreductase RutF
MACLPPLTGAFNGSQTCRYFQADHGRCYIIGVADSETQNAFTAAYVMQVSYNPLLVAIGINPEHSSYPILRAGEVFSVNVLRQEHIDLARHFGRHSGSDFNKLADVRWRTGQTGAPILLDALAHLECHVVQRIRAGDHELVVAEVVDGALSDPDAIPMVYADTGDLDGSSALYPSKREAGTARKAVG